jgi:DNA-binding transcriptional MerR regulator
VRSEAVGYTIGQVAELAGVTVRTLHHYDRIGLLVPRGRSGADYRRYDDSDLERLQQILLYRELGFQLRDIAGILDDSGTDAAEHLRRQRALLMRRIDRLQLMVAAVDRELEAREMGNRLTPEERFEVWGDFDPDDYAEEAERRWGGDAAFRESQRKVAGYSKGDWAAINAEGADITRRLIDAMRSGEPATGDTARRLAEEHRRHITRWFYDCGYDIHTGLGEMYVNDPRFAATYNDMADGLAAYLRDAIRANARGG